MHKAYKEMDPELIRKLLEGQENVIAPAVEKEQAFLQSVPCPSCGKYETQAKMNIKHPFSRGNLLTNKVLECLACKAEFEPHTRVISKAPTVSSD